MHEKAKVTVGSLVAVGAYVACFPHNGQVVGSVLRKMSIGVEIN